MKCWLDDFSRTLKLWDECLYVSLSINVCVGCSDSRGVWMVWLVPVRLNTKGTELFISLLIQYALGLQLIDLGSTGSTHWRSWQWSIVLLRLAEIVKRATKWVKLTWVIHYRIQMWFMFVIRCLVIHESTSLLLWVFLPLNTHC